MVHWEKIHEIERILAHPLYIKICNWCWVGFGNIELGEGARRRLQMFAVNFENRLNGKNAPPVGPGALRPGVLQEDAGAVAERRGLLDDDEGEEEIEFEMREKKSK